MCSMLRLLACVAGASAVYVVDEKDEQRILFLGASLDRNAVVGFCAAHGDYQKAFAGTQPVQCAWCGSQKLQLRLGYMFHPGVGLNGDLEKPTGLHRGPPTRAILQRWVDEAAMFMLKAEPTLVVVDSSLWDLMAWRVATETDEDLPEPREVTEARVQQWCQHDLPGLLGNVSEHFPRSRIAFRTAPTIQRDNYKMGKRDIELLYKCIMSSSTQGKLFGKYAIIDYHAVMEKLIDRNVPGLFRDDGYHPTEYPSALYLNEVLLHVGLPMPDPPGPLVEWGKTESKAKIIEEVEVAIPFKDPPEPQFDLDYSI